ncbi:MAG: site-2 protease family protein [Patescibacteria group bacterium]
MPDLFIIQVYSIAVIILSAVFHEYAHGWVADRLGDPTPGLAGRLTLNPIAHLDLWGSILMPLFLYFMSGGAFVFAYAKPVPFNPFNLRDQRWGILKVGIAGVVVNLILAVGFGMIIRFVPTLSAINVLALGIIVQLNLLLAIFNIIPIPPLDGSKVLFSLLPDRFFRLKLWMERYSFILLIALLILIFSTGFIGPIIRGLFTLITGIS